MIKLYAFIMNEFLDAELAAASTAGFSFKVESEENGLSIKCSGFNEKVERVVDFVTKALKGIVDSLAEPTFNVHKASFQQELSVDITTGSFFNHFDTTITERHKLHKFNYYDAIKNIKFEDFKDSITKLFEKLHLKVLVQGNFTMNDATSIGNLILQNFQAEPISDVKLCHLRIHFD